MNKVYLLDCTLRDGGYVNDWQFGKDNIATIFERLVSANIDIIEVGFLDESRLFDCTRTIMPDTLCVERIFGNFSKGNSMIVGMIDYGTCSIENLQPCKDSVLDGIRVIFKKDKMHSAMKFCKQVKDLGYKVFCQLVSITSYNDNELNQIIQLVNDCHPYAMSIVDTYGLCDSNALSHIVNLIDESLDKDIVLGYHAHNNFQLGYANAISVINSKIDRDILVDGTLYGMGKSAGNAPIELLAMYMNSNYGANYNLGQIQEAISMSILDLYHKKPWGYTLFYYIAASNKCHPDYVSYLMNKRTLSVTSVNEILQSIPKSEKLNKNIKMIESLYLEYQKRECDDTASLEILNKKLFGKEILMIGPGQQAKLNKGIIQKYIYENNPVVIPINYVPEDIVANYLFLTNSRRYLQMSHNITNHKKQGVDLIATSNLTDTDNEFDYVVNYCNLIDESEEFPDNSMKMLIRLLIKVGCKEISLAGFDGYTADNVNYFDSNMEYSFVKEKANYLNQSAKDFFKNISNEVNIKFITKSHYQE